MPVIIVGGGPVGLVLAMDLAALGVQSILVNSDESTRWHPKGSTHNSRTMEHYRRLGIAAGVRKLGLPADHPTDVAYLTRLDGYELARIRMPSELEKMERVHNAPVTDQIPEPIHRANQMYVEAFLLEHARTLRAVELRYGWECVGFRDEGGEVSVDLEERASGARESLRAGYLVGCDGGQSFVRRTLGIRYQGYDRLEQAFYGGRMVSTHLRAPTLYRDVLDTRRAWQYWVVNPELRTAIVALNGRDEFLLWTKLPNPDMQPDDAMAVDAMQRCAGAEIPIEVLGHRPWTAGVALVAERFSQGRVFLCGDSVHLFTPTGGFGMNTGLEDAANLAWKLAACVQGWGGPRLLATYEAERKPIAHRNTGAARALAKNVGDVKTPPELEHATPAGEAARREAGAFLSTFGEEFASLGVQLGARYDDSPIIVADGTSPPRDDPVIYTPSACPGGRAPHAWLPDRSSLFDHFGLGFTLLRFNGEGNDHDSHAYDEAAKTRGIPLKIIDIDCAEIRDLYERDFALIRPDGYVAWRGDRLPSDGVDLMEQVTGGRA